jgi:hypothetical protein
MNKIVGIIGIIGIGGEGGTFLDWTIHYLVGDTYLKVISLHRISNTVINSNLRPFLLVDNPLKDNGTAHQHQKTHPANISSAVECAILLEKITLPMVSVHTMYIVPSSKGYGNLGYSDFTRELVNKLPNTKFIQCYPTNEIVMDLTERIIKKVKRHNLTKEEVIARSQMLCKDVEKDLNSFPKLYYQLSIKDIYYHLDTEIHNVMSWLNLSIDESRLENWKDVYKQWQLYQNFTTPILN